MTEFSEQRVEEIKEAFELLSKDGDNLVHYCQIGDIVRALGECPTNEDVIKFLGDPSKEDMNTKKMSCEEFLPIFSKIINEAQKGTFEDFMEGMRVFDKDGNGTVMGAEIRHVLTTLGEKLTAVQVSEMMQGQEDSSGVIVYADFCKYLLEAPKAAF